MPSYTTESDGSRVYPKCGSPPLPPEGYYAEPSDPFRHRLKLPDCPYREDGFYKKKCGTIMHFKVCQKGFPCQPLDCLKCVQSGRLAGIVGTEKATRTTEAVCKPLELPHNLP